MCFSKGLGAPIGSCLAGSKAFTARARRFKQQFGGGMRQAGIIAAGAPHAVKHYRARLAEDHENAWRLAVGLAGTLGIDIDVATVDTNIVRFRVTATDAAAFVEELFRRGVYMLPSGSNAVRAIPYLNISRAEIEAALAIIGAMMREVFAAGAAVRSPLYL